jgi:hypothetical protein
MGQRIVQPGACRMCGQVGVALAPYRYCYLCFGRFGTSTQVTMLMLAYNPTLPEEVVRRVLGRQCSEAVVSSIYQSVQALVEEEVARSQAEQWVTALPECCIHTRNSVIYRTVYLGQQDEQVGSVLLAGKQYGCLRWQAQKGGIGRPRLRMRGTWRMRVRLGVNKGGESMGQKRLFVSEPYREACYLCQQRKQVVAIHVPCGLATQAVGSTRLCRECAVSLARLLIERCAGGVSASAGRRCEGREQVTHAPLDTWFMAFYIKKTQRFVSTFALSVPD